MPAIADDIDQLIKDLKDPNSDVRQDAAYHLGSIKDVRAVNPLIEALKDEDLEVVFSSSNSLIDIIKANPQAVDLLIRALNDKDETVRYYGSDILGETNDARAVDALIVALKDESEQAKILCHALARSTVRCGCVRDLLAFSRSSSSSFVNCSAGRVLTNGITIYWITTY